MTRTLMTITVTALLLCPLTDAANKLEVSKNQPLTTATTAKPASVTVSLPTKTALPAPKSVPPAPKPVAKGKAVAKAQAKPEPVWSQIGTASWYGTAFHGHLTANGEHFDMNQFTAAHLTLPLGTWVKVTNLRNKKFVYVRINDRGPFIENRILDVSYSAAQKLGFSGNGLAKIKIEKMENPTLALSFNPEALF